MASGELRYDGLVALVTGSGRGLGAQYARDLAARGCKVVVNDLGVAISDTDGSGDAPAENPAVSVVASIVDAGGDAVLDTSSIASPDGAAAMVGAALDTWGRLDIVINNAGVVRQGPIEDFPPERLDAMLATHLSGTVNVCRAAWPSLVASPCGRILNLSSGAAIGGISEMTGYGLAKLGVVGFTRALSLEAAKHGINVNVLAPYAKTRPGGMGPIPAGPALNDWLGLDQVSPVACWLVHPECDVTGEWLSVGGGYIGRVVLAVTPGWRQRDMTVEDVRDHMATVLSTEGLRVVEAGNGDLDRVFAGYREFAAGFATPS